MAWFAKKPRTRALTAAGQRIVPQTAVMIGSRRNDWQRLAWAYRTSVPELRFVGGFVATQLARVRWYVAEVGPEGHKPRPVTGKPPKKDESPSEVSLRTQRIAMDALERLDLNSQGSSMAGRAAENFEYAGECYLLGEVNSVGVEEWSIRSVSEVKVSREGHVELVEPGKAQGRPLDLGRVELFRLWTPDPEYLDWADAKITACLGVLEEIVVYDRQARAAARSRIAAGSLLYVPEELSLTRPGSAPVDVQAGVEDDDDLFMAELTAGMLTPISSDEDPSAIVPLVVRGPAMGPEGRAMKDLIGTVQIPREDVPDIIAKRDAAVQKLAHGMDFPPEIITGLSDANHWCVDEQTEVLSRRGWLRHDQVQLGDIVLTLNHDTGLAEWGPVRDLYRASVVDEPMCSMETRTHSSLTTRGHRWPVEHLRGGKNLNNAGEVVDGRRWEREWATSAELTRRDRIPIAAPCVDQPTEAKWADEVVELVSWYWTEGHHRGQNLCIAQSHTRNPERVARIRGALTRLYGPPVDSLRGHGAPRWRESVQSNDSSYGGPVTVFHLSKEASAPLRDAAPDKVVSPQWVQELTPAQLALFVDISCQGDGQHYRAGLLDMWQRDPANLEAFELALLLSGRSVTRTENSGGHRTGVCKTVAINPCKADDLARSQGREPVVSERSYTGVVWCPTTDNHTWFARRNGSHYFTGNSSWIVSDATVRQHLEPRCENLADSITASYLRETCLAQGCPPEEVARLCIWYDATELSQPADPMGIAKDLWDRDALSDKALAAAGGYEPDDMPPLREKLARLLARGRIAPQSVPIIVALEAATDEDPALRLAVHLAEQMAVPTTVLPDPSSKRKVLDMQRPSEAQASPQQPIPDDAGPSASRTAPPGVAASAARDGQGRFATPDGKSRYKVDETLCRQLAAVDSRAIAELGGFIDAAILDIVRQAANRIRSGALRAGAGSPERALFDSPRSPVQRDPVAVIAAAGPDQPWTVTDQQALEGALDRIQPRWMAAVRSAANRISGLLRKLLGNPPRRDLLDEFERRAAQAWPRLAGHIQQTAIDVLHGATPRPDPEADEPVLPRSVLAGALTEVGGLPETSPGIGTDGSPIGTQPATGLSGGTLVQDEIADAGGVELGRQWSWDGPPREPFTPHFDLDGAHFTGWDDPVLAVRPGDEWVGTNYRPGDHEGCWCHAGLIVAVPREPGTNPEDAIDEIASLRAKHITERSKATS